MPYKKKKEMIGQPITKLLKANGYNAPALAGLLGCSETKARMKLNEPWRFNIGDLDKIRRFGHISIEEIRGSIN